MLYFPDYVDGGEWSVQLALSHIAAADEDAAVLVTAYDREGQPIPGFFDSEGTFGIPPLGTRILRSAGVGEIRRGWIEVRTDTASVSGLLTYRNTETGLEVSVATGTAEGDRMGDTSAFGNARTDGSARRGLRGYASAVGPTTSGSGSHPVILPDAMDAISTT